MSRSIMRRHGAPQGPGVTGFGATENFRIGSVKRSQYVKRIMASRFKKLQHSRKLAQALKLMGRDLVVIKSD